MTTSARRDRPPEVPGLDIGRVSEWMASPGIGARSPLRFDRFGHGKSNLTFEVADADGRRWVLRRPPLGRLLPGAHDVVREHRILAALEQTDVPVPRVTALAEPGEVADVPLLAMDYVEGFVVQDSAAAQLLPPARRLEVGLALCSALGRVHAVDLEGAGLDDLASHSPYAHRQLKRWHGQWERSRTRDIPEIDDLASRLRAAAPEPGELTLVHGDFHLRNVITSTADGSVLAILDWELCTLGDPLADLGGLFAYWPEPGEPATAVNPASTLPGFPSRDELAHEYARTTGRGLDALGFWHVLALWKVAIIAEGVLRRNRDEPLNAASTTSLRPEGVDELVSRAIATAEKEGI